MHLAKQRSLGHPAELCEFGGTQYAIRILVDVVDDMGDRAFWLQSGPAFIAARHSHQADDHPSLSVQWNFRRDTPFQITLLVIPNFQTVEKRLTRAKDLLVI